ncbi:DEAD/DEAH box helicase family protein [Candidatus Wolfebacteria bacterium]|nr:DEAD/DEAH box helicase family protein [Candidatus Wolfebacteria bacterium]
MKINEATSTDLKIIKELEKLGWKAGDTLLYQQEYLLSPEQQKDFEGKKSVKPDIVLTDLNGDIVAVFENKFEDEKKGLVKLRALYSQVLKPRFLYACSPERILFYDTAWKGFDATEFRRVDGLMSLEEIKLKIEQERKINSSKEIEINTSIAGGMDKIVGKERYYQRECIETLIENYKQGKQKMLVHMATGLGKTRTTVALAKAMLDAGIARKILFVVDRVMLAQQALDDGFSLIGKDYTSVRLSGSNYKQQKHANIHVVVVDTLENIYKDLPNTFYDLLIVDECHRSININRKLIFDHFLCPRIGLTATPRTAIAKEGKNIPEEDLAIIDTYKLFGCESGQPDYQFDMDRAINEGFLAPYEVVEVKTYLTKLAEEKGVEFDTVFDPDEQKKITLTGKKNIKLEQLNRRYLAKEQIQRVAEEIQKHTVYGEKVILFGVSQAHCQMLASALNEIFDKETEKSGTRYAESIISENNDMNHVLKTWFKKPNKKPYIAVSVDIMSTGVDIPCVRYIAFSALTKSVGKYTQMLGRGTRLDPKTGKFSFKVLDFVGLCKRMEDNGKGTLKENKKVVVMAGGTTSQGSGSGEHYDLTQGIIDNPDPENLIQRVLIHGDKIKVIDNIPIEEARKIFEGELDSTQKEEIIKIKEKVKENPEYEPTEEDIEKIKDLIKNPEVYLDEGQLQKVYGFPQGTIWDFFLHAFGIKEIPSVKSRIEDGFNSYINTYNFTDNQIKTLRRIKDIFVANKLEKKEFSVDDIFSNPIFEKLVGSKQYVEELFNGEFGKIIKDLEDVIKV